MRALLAVVAAAGFSLDAAAAAARVEFSIGRVTVAGADGRERPLAKGAEVDSGDTVRTDASGRAQLRFTDGAYVSLQPNTEYRISDYRFEGKTDGSEKGLFGLTRGAMRTVTGLVGRVNRDAYKVTTPTATVGIRGTGGVIQILDNGSTLVTGTSGIWSLSNQFGSITVPAGLSGLAPKGTPPTQPPPSSQPGGPPPLATSPGGTSPATPPAAPPPVQLQTNPLMNVPGCGPAGCSGPRGEIISPGGQ